MMFEERDHEDAAQMLAVIERNPHALGALVHNHPELLHRLFHTHPEITRFMKLSLFRSLPADTQSLLIAGSYSRLLHDVQAAVRKIVPDIRDESYFNNIVVRVERRVTDFFNTYSGDPAMGHIDQLGVNLVTTQQRLELEIEAAKIAIEAINAFKKYDRIDDIEFLLEKPRSSIGQAVIELSRLKERS
jgi:hypothetical protein